MTLRHNRNISSGDVTVVQMSINLSGKIVTDGPEDLLWKGMKPEQWAASGSVNLAQGKTKFIKVVLHIAILCLECKKHEKKSRKEKASSLWFRHRESEQSFS
jgi:hypothetical protein